MLRSTSLLSLPDRNCLRGRIVLVGATLLASSSVLLSGCGMGTITTAAPPSQGTGTFMQGKVHGGQQPVNGAVIQLYAAGTTGYGSAPTALLKDPVSTGSDGSFTITSDYTCPAGDAEVYITATGGNPGLTAGTNNAALVLMAALGSCDTLQANAASTFIFMDEVTTVAAAYALSPFAVPNATGTGISVGTSIAGSAGTNPGNVAGLTNAMATVNNLVNLSTGQALTITPAYASNPVAYLNSSTVPQARINTLADILASCVNTSGTGTPCSTLFAAATPPGGTAPVDTLQAALNIAQHPGTNVAALYALSSATAPFQPTLSAAPTDWMIAVTYTGAGLGVPPQTTGVAQVQNNAMAIDATGDIWVTAYASDVGSTVNNSSMIAEFTNLGVPITPATTLSAANPPVVTYGGYQNNAAGLTAPTAIAIDESENAWFAGENSNAYINAITSGLSPLLTTPIGAEPVQQVKGFAIDGTGNIWATGGPTGGNVLEEYSSSGALLSPSSGYSGGGNYGNNYYSTLSQLIFDSTGSNLWASDGNFGDLYRISAATGQLVYDYFPTGGTLTALATGASGNIFGCPTSATSLQVFNASSNTAAASYPITTGRGCGSKMIVDGVGNIWVMSSVLDVYSSTGALLSPAATGYTATSSGEAPTLFGTSDSAVDGSGNVWVLNSGTGNNAANATNVLVELVGAAAPVVTPVSLALQGGEVATRP